MQRELSTSYDEDVKCMKAETSKWKKLVAKLTIDNVCLIGRYGEVKKVAERAIYERKWLMSHGLPSVIYFPFHLLQHR